MGIAGTIILVVFIVITLFVGIGVWVYALKNDIPMTMSQTIGKIIKETEAKEEEKRQEKVYSDLVEMIMKKSEKVE